MRTTFCREAFRRTLSQQRKPVYSDNVQKQRTHVKKNGIKILSRSFAMMVTLSFMMLSALMLQKAAAQSPIKLKRYDDWAVYAYTLDKKKVCYVLSMPLSAQPTNVKHGDNFFLVSQFPEMKKSFEPQFMADYPLQTGSKVQVTIDDRSFTFFTKDSSAWLASTKEEEKLVDLMRKGSKMKVEAISKRGTHTSYVFSLKGITKALQEADRCR